MIQEFKNFGYFIHDISWRELQSVRDEIKETDGLEDYGEKVDGHVDKTFKLSTSVKDLEEES